MFGLFKKKTEYPARSVTLRFSHPNVGDIHFMPLMLDAHKEYVQAARKSDIEQFQASNGITVTWVKP